MSLYSFTRGFRFPHAPLVTRQRLQACLLDILGVAAAARDNQTSQLLRQYASDHYPAAGIASRLLFDGRCVHPLGTAWTGGFCVVTKAHSRETYKMDCDWGHVELASVPCAYSTAEGMLNRAGVKAGEHLLITGASGGVGSAAIQLAKRPGAKITAIAAQRKADQMRGLGAELVI